MPERLAVFDLDNTLLREPNLFERSLRVANHFTNDNLHHADGVIDWVAQEVLEEIAATHGEQSRTYVEHAVRLYLQNNRAKRTHDDLIALAAQDTLWPQDADFYAFTPVLAAALQATGYHLHCETYSPAFIAKQLLCTQGIPMRDGSLRFDSVTGSTYETQSDGRLNGTASTPGNKARSLRRRFGDTSPEFACGDTMTDYPMLTMARIAIAMNAEPQLRTLATSQTMTLVDEYDSLIEVINPVCGSQRVRREQLHDMRPDEIIQLVSY